MIIPLSTDLRLGRQPWITWIVIGLCVIVFGLQVESAIKYEVSVAGYCKFIYEKNQKKPDSRDLLAQNTAGCSALLSAYHTLSLRGIEAEKIEADIREGLGFISDKDKKRLFKSLRKHHEKFSRFAPTPLDEKIMYFPESFNPLTMITSSLAHADVFHIAFNLIFFFAFAPAVELLVGSALRYSASLLAIAVGCSLFYSMFALAEGSNIPGLGLSGVVMGVIGMSAFLMPRARINTLIWFVVPITWIPIPAWFMALWFIGFDAWELLSEGMDNGVNLVAHVSGGVVGYFIARFFFKKRKEEIQEELDEEIEHMKRSRSAAGLTINNATSLHKDMRALEKQHDEHMAMKARIAHEDKLYNMVRTDQSSEAMALILADADDVFMQPEEYEDIFKQVAEWKKHRTYLCVGRLLIDLYLQRRHYSSAFKVLKACLEVSREFVLANPRDVLMLAQEANRQQLYKLAFALLHRTEQRYTPDVEYLPCGLLEADILAHHLGKPQLAVKRLEELKQVADPVEKQNLSALQSELAPAI